MNQCSPIAGTHPPKRMLCEITAEGQEARALRGCTEQQDEEADAPVLANKLCHT
jgi:hypothetical protein